MSILNSLAYLTIINTLNLRLLRNDISDEEYLNLVAQAKRALETYSPLILTNKEGN
jgi:hypothetical protein